MQGYLHGSTFVVRNMPGAGHLIGANAISASKPDGVTFGTFNTGLIYNQISGQDGGKFDLNKIPGIAKAAFDPRVSAITTQSPIKTWKDLIDHKSPLNFATAGVSSASYVETVMLTGALKLPIKLLTGYNGTDNQLPMRIDEIVVSIASRSSHDQCVKNAFGRYIAQIDGKDTDVPQLSSLVTDPKGKDLIALVQSQGDIARLTAGAPSSPADLTAALTGACRKAMEDKELQERVEKLERPVEPLYGDDVLKALQAALNEKAKAVALLKEALGNSKALSFG